MGTCQLTEVQTFQLEVTQVGGDKTVPILELLRWLR